MSQNHIAGNEMEGTPAGESIWCEIRVRGQLDETWTAWFDGLVVSDAGNGETVLAGELADQTALHGVLIKIRDLGLPLLGMTCREAARGDSG